MYDALTNLFVAGPFIPHGHCYLWKPSLVWLHLTSDALIALAYYSIPLALFYFVRKRQDLPFHGIFLWFAAFIIACGTTHLAEIWTLWHPTYWLSGALKASTAIISLSTAFQLLPLIPQALALPSPAQLEQANQDLQTQIQERLRVEEELRHSQNLLELRVQERTTELVRSNQQLQQEISERRAALQERQRAEETLRISQERLILAQQIGRIGTCEWNLRSGNLTWTKEMEALFDLAPGCFEGRYEDWLKRVHPDDRSRVEALVQRTITKKAEFDTEFRILLPKGGLRWVAAKAQLFCDDDGKPCRWIGVNMDITDRKQVEEAFRANAERLSLALTAARMGDWSWDAATDLVTFSEQSAKIFGIPSGPHMTWTEMRNLLHPDDRSRAQLEVEQAITDHSDYSIEYQVSHSNGETRWVAAKGRAQYDLSGQAIGMLGVIQDISDRKQAEQEREQLLVREQAARLEAEAAKEQITQTLESITDGFLAFDRNWRFTYVNHEGTRTLGRSPEALIGTNLWEEFPELAETSFGQLYQQAVAAGEPLELEDYYPPFRAWFSVRAYPSSAGLALYFRNISDRKQAEAERENLLLREQAARTKAEAAEQRARFLAEASTVLAASLDYEQTLKSLAQLAVPTLADWCIVDVLTNAPTKLLSEHSLKRVAIAHVDPAKVERATELHHQHPPNLDAAQGVANVLRTGQSECYPEISDAELMAIAYSEEHFKLLQGLGLKSVMIVPLIARDKILGVISFVSLESAHSYGPDALALAEEIGRRAAIALDNARLYREAQQAKQVAERAMDRTTRLQTVTAALSESLTPLQVAEVIVEQSMTAIKADSALMALLSDDRTELEIVQAVGYKSDLVESWRRFPITAPVPLAETVRTGEPFWAASRAVRLADYPHLAEIYGRYDYESWMSLPLRVEGKSVGGMLLSFNESKELDQEDRDFILALTQQCAQAIARAQLYEAERKARAEAEQVNRIKDEFLAVLSHELRTPLNPILGWARLLRTRKFDQQATDRALETIERNAKLQTQLIEDLLDISRILQGKMSLSADLVNLESVVEAALETVQLAAESKGVQIQTAFAATLELVSGDATRLQQIVWNLLTNAVKFTPPGGQVTVRLEQDDHNAQIIVSDTGKGIAPAFLPYVFDYFRQEDGKTTRQFGGLGLGLAIVRHLTELHGGTVQAVSPGEGLGATFVIRLPLLRDEASRHQGKEKAVDLSFAPQVLPLAGIRVLTVDDDADMRELLKLVLEQYGATVKSTASAAEALSALDQFESDVLISDIGMPDMDGYMLMRQVRQRLLQGENLLAGSQTMPKAIALTAYTGELNQQQALQAGFQRHIAKPIEPDELVRTIALLVGRKEST